MASNPPSRARGLQQQSTSSTNSTSRRNLFSSALSRRPTTNPSTSTSTATVHSTTTTEEQQSEDIIVRDEHGNYRLDLPHMTPLPRDEAREEREVENRLIETYMKHQQHIEPNELKATLQASLQAKVATLEEDKWMFEKDESPPQ